MLPVVAMETEASHMLEAALEQMDDIIAGSKAASAEFSGGAYEPASPVGTETLQVARLAEELRLALELQPNREEREKLRSQLPEETLQALLDWLQNGSVNFCSPSDHETYQERLLRLEGDKESLVLQVSVLTDQVEAQGEKIRDLESSLEEHRRKLASTEEMLQQELVSRTSLETQKLNLMDEVSYLKLKLVSMEETCSNSQQQDRAVAQQNKAECVVNLISELQEQMCRFQEEISTRIQEKRAQEEAQQGAPLPPPQAEPPDASLSRKEGHCVDDLVQEVKHLKSKVEELEGEKSRYEKKLRATKSLITQLSSLKLTVELTQLEKQRWRGTQAEICELQQVVASKDVEIECLQTQLLSRGGSSEDSAERVELYFKQLINKYQEYQRLKVGMESLLASNDEKDRRIEELSLLLGRYRKMKEIPALTQGSSEEELSSLKLRAVTQKAHSDMVSSRGSSPLLLSTSPFQDASFQSCADASLVPMGDASFLNGSWHRGRLLSSSLEELQSGSLPKAVEIQQSQSDVRSEGHRMEQNKYQTLPGKLSKKRERRADLNGDAGRERPPDRQDDDDFTRCRSASAPALGSPGKQDVYDAGRAEFLLSDTSPFSSGVDSGQQSPVSPDNRKAHRGIRKLWGKIRRSQSGSPVQVHDPELQDFKRGGVRATAGPRLARTGKTRDLKLPFSKWSAEQVCDWLEDIGLGQYGVPARHWVSGGQTLLAATSQDLEKEMSVKNPLHRKKLQLAIKTFTGNQMEKSAELDYVWVTRWLDDIGLPQYKDQFNDGRVDGLMLQFLTVNDLLFLKVTSHLHHLSIKSAIRVLHANRFHPNCLKRRPSNESRFTPDEVSQWSNHRVMEWLRSVDLAEYAPNLRGSGVHGGLIMLEPRFTADTLAMLLNIPPPKTLLRRHLTTNFHSLVGARAQREKRDYAQSAASAPLSITAKVKPKKSGFSTLRRRRSDESADYVCPMESLSPQSAVNGVQIHPYAGFRGLSPILDQEPSRDQMANAESTILQIEALSESINNLTFLIGRDELRRSETALV